MRNKIFNIIICSCLACIAFACKKPYNPAVVSLTNNYLVVEGVINTGNDSTKIKLSRTAPLADTATSSPELKAQVYVLDDHAVRHNLTEMANGIYACSPLNLQNSQKCSLHITTSDQKEYVSDDVEIDNTPAIDSIGYSTLATGLQFYAYTHDPANKINYYRWDFDETWEYSSFYRAVNKYENDQVVFTNDVNTNLCWTTKSSQQILLGSTSALSSSVVNRLSLAYVDVSTGKLALGYSMLLRQYALTKDAYQYWQNLKKNTEQLGSIFDAQPSEIKGNIHAAGNPNEPVIGYVSASTVTTKRIVLLHNNLNLYSLNYYPPPTAEACPPQKIPIEPQATLSARLSRSLASGDTTVYSAYGPSGSPIVGYLIAPSECVDCRVKIKNGTNVRPSFWPGNL